MQDNSVHLPEFVSFHSLPPPHLFHVGFIYLFILPISAATHFTKQMTLGSMQQNFKKCKQQQLLLFKTLKTENTAKNNGERYVNNF